MDNQFLLFDDALNYLGELGVRKYFNNVAAGQRRGQAFFNALTHEDQVKLIGTSADPHASNERISLIHATRYLLEH